MCENNNWCSPASDIKEHLEEARELYFLSLTLSYNRSGGFEMVKEFRAWKNSIYYPNNYANYPRIESL